MRKIITLLIHSLGLLIKMPWLLIEYKLKRRQFINQFSDSLEIYSFSDEARKELRAELIEHTSLLQVIKTISSPSE